VKKLPSELFESYIKNYKWLLLSLLVIIILFFIPRYYHLQNYIINIASYVQTIFLGLIAFSIPFLWNAYQRILRIREKSIRKDIESTLNKEVYIKHTNYFAALLQYPTGLLVFLGLFLTPFLSPILIIPILIVSFIYFVFLPQIFHWIEKRSATSLRDFLNYKEAKSEDLQKVFKELWQNDDQSIEKNFQLKIEDLAQIYIQKIDHHFDIIL